MKRLLLSLVILCFGCVCFSRPSIAAERFGDPPMIYFESDVLVAFGKAIEKQKALVIIFVCSKDGRECPYCYQTKNTLRTEPFQKFTNDAIFVIATMNGETSNDQAAATLYKKLQVRSTVCISFIHPRLDRIEEIARIQGYFEPDQLMKEMDRMITKTNASIFASKLSGKSE
ncbi:Hypothetical protein PBC10988_29090 [Planctomycetales bacterium 10988]|nr:Hypothetical protein PBC10988_29090 [Planctomycetales bacterium 10988]